MALSAWEFHRLWQAIEHTLGAKKVTDIKVLKNQIDFGIVDHTNHHGISKGYTAEADIRAWEQKLKDLSGWMRRSSFWMILD